MDAGAIENNKDKKLLALLLGMCYILDKSYACNYFVHDFVGTSTPRER